MTQECFFGNAKWVGASQRSGEDFATLYGHFFVNDAKKVCLNVLGLGFFKCYINGVCINPESFLPLSSEYESSAGPEGEIFSANRVYVPSFDITSYVKNGENIIAIHYGGGWYCAGVRRFGLPKAIYRIEAVYSDGVNEFVSCEDSFIAKSYVFEYNMAFCESHDYRKVSPDFDKIPKDAEPAAVVEGLKTEYFQTDCPVDKVMNILTPKLVGKGRCGMVYDAGHNTSGHPVIKISAKAGENVRVIFSEEILPDGTLDLTHSHKQTFCVVSDGKERTVGAQFTWFGFRYFEIIGDAIPVSVLEIYADIARSSTFLSSDETLNWIYETFIHTILTNMHTGHPSDCPHLERRGYTGDGQLTAHAVLSILDAKSFYEKWLQDIADSQDTLSGHIQYTAPYVRSGGGPGGWGAAIVEVPYQLYRHYGDKTVLEKYYPNMRRFIDYLEEHSEFGLVTSDQKGRWCLGDWCGPNVLYPERDITSHNQQVIIPAPMVNTYFMVKSLNTMKYIAGVIGKTSDIPEYEEKIALRKKAINAAYFNTFDGNFVMNVQGANSYAVDLGLGSDLTYTNMVNYYKKLGHYDTGIFATDIVTRVLFERGDFDLAFNLLTQNGDQGFEHWRQNGATTFHEYWDSNRSRSHNHPMFGSVVAYLFEYILGIAQRPGAAGYNDLIISPSKLPLSFLSGSMKTPNGNVSVSYEKKEGKIYFNIVIPAGVKALFKYGECENSLNIGENVFSLDE